MSYYDIINKHKPKGTASESDKTSKKQGTSGYQAIIDSYKPSYDFIDNDYLNTFITDANDYFGSLEGETVNWGNAGDVYATRKAKWDDISKREGYIRGWLEANEERLDPEWYTDFLSALDSYKEGGASSMDYFKGATDYYGQWATEDEYNKYYDLALSPKESDDFEQYSKAGANVANPEWNDAHAPLQIGNWKPFGDGEEVGNWVTFAEANAENAITASAQAVRSGASHPFASRVWLINTYMKDEEKAIYNYYIGKGDKQKADEYLAYIMDVLNQRAGGALAKQVEDEGKLAEIFFSTVSGAGSFLAGVGNLDNYILGTEADPTTAMQYAYGQTSSNNEGFFKGVNDIGYTIGNMLPSVLFSAVTTSPLAGTLVMGASATGNAYSEMRNLGYGERESRGYATLVGASEGALQYFLGGISKLGGKLSGNAISKFISGLDNAFARTAIQLGGNMASEGLEESIQTVLEPAFKALMTGEEYEAAEWGDIMYSALLGALSAGVMEGAPTIAGTAINNYKTKQAYGGQSQALVDEALSSQFSDIKAIGQKYQDKLKSGKTLSGANLSRLIESTDSSKLKSAVLQRLGDLGEKGDVTAIADVLIKQAKGEKLSARDVKILNNSTAGHLVSTELNRDNIRSGNLGNEWSESIGTRRIDPETYSRSGQTVYVGKDGKSENVSIKKIVSTKGGTLSYELSDGRIVSQSDIKYGSEREAITHSVVSKMDVSAETANAIVRAVKTANGNTPGFYAGIPLAYEYGKISNEKGLKNVNLPDNIKKFIYDLGVSDASKNTSGGKKNEGKAGIRVRDSGKRDGGKNTEGKVSSVESDTGKDKGREGKSADSEAARLVDKGRKVNGTDLGIEHAVEGRSVTVIDDESSFTTSMKAAKRLGEERGLKVTLFVGDNIALVDDNGNVFEARGHINTGTKEVFVRADHPMHTAEQIMKHEVGHDMIANGEVDIDEVRERVKNIVGAENIDELAEIYMAQYAGSGLTEAEIWEELICDSIADMNIFSKNLIGELAEIAMPGIKDVALNTKGGVTKAKTSVSKNSYAGISSQTASQTELGRAQEMADEGIDSETIRKDTGWFVGYDGKWRYEIDDSLITWHLDTAEPNPERLFKFGERIFKLTDLIDHPALFEAYPQLKNVTVWENPEAKTAGYVVGRSTDAFTVKSLKDTSINKDFILHEIQHLIQNIEGFTPGGSVEQFSYKSWGEKEYEAYEKRNEIAKNLYAILRRHGVSITKSDIASVRTAFEIRDGIIDYNFMLIESLADNNPRTRSLLDEYYKQVQILNLTTPEGQYHAVAGEVEAYDVQARRNMTPEQRKNTRPNIDRTDVVVDESATVSYFAKGVYNEETAGIHEQIRNSQTKLNNMSVVFSGITPLKIGKAYEAGTWAIGELKKYGFQADRQNLGKVFFDETSIRDAMKYLDTDAEKVSIVAIYKVIKQGIQIGEHGNHKDRGKHTITLAAPVEINGTRGNMAVVINLRNNKYKVHRILMPDGSVFEFAQAKNNAEQEMQRGVPKRSLANATSSASNIIIVENAEKVNPSSKFSSPEQAKESGKVSDAKFSIEFAGDVAKSRKSNRQHGKSSREIDASYEDYSKPITIHDVEVLRSLDNKSVNDFEPEHIKITQKWAYKFYTELGEKSPFFRAWFGDWRGSDKSKAPYLEKVKTANVSSAAGGSKLISEGLKNGTLFRGNAFNSDTKYEINIGRQVYNDTLTYANRALSRDNDVSNYAARLSLLHNIKEIAETAILLDTVTVKKDESNADRTFVHKFYTTAKVNNGYYIVKLTVDEFNSNNGTIRRAYNVNNIEISPIAVSQVYSPAGTIGDIGDYLSNSIIADLFALVKSQDNSFKPNAVNPLLLNKDGTPKVFYHGTPNGKFYTFDYENVGKVGGSQHGYGFYFTDSEREAGYYTQGRGTVIKAYIKMESPIIATDNDLAKNIEKIFERLPMYAKTNLADQYGSLENAKDSLSRYDNGTMLSILGGESEMNPEVFNRILLNLGYDGIIYSEDGYANEYVVFKPEQIKSVDENIGTFSKYERDSRYSRELDLANVISEEAKPVSNRTLLTNALDTVATTEEKDLLSSYRARIEDIEKLQAQLVTNRAEAKTLRFKKGVTPEERSRLAKLDAEAKRLEERINKHDKKLLELESTEALKKVVEREKKKARQKALEDSKKSLEKRKVRMAESDLRQKIQKMKQKFMTMLQNPTDSLYVPEELATAIISVCESIETSRPLYKPNGEINKAQVKRNEAMTALADLKKAYENLKNDPDSMVKDEYDDEINNYLLDLQNKYSGKNIADMTLDDLNGLYEILRSIDDTLRDARKMIGLEGFEYATDVGKAIIDEQRDIRSNRKNGEMNWAEIVGNSLIDKSLSPMKAIYRMVGYNEDSPLYQLFRDIEQGVWQKEKFVMDSTRAFEELTTGKNAKAYEDAMYKPFGDEITDMNGKKFNVTKMQMMQAVLSYEREQANSKLHHVTDGGFTFADVKYVAKGNMSKAVKANNAHTVKFGAVLAMQFKTALKGDAWAQEYMAKAREFFNKTARKAINDVTVQLKHRIVASETAYIPFEVNKNFVNQEITAENSIQKTISGYGMLKDLVHSAPQPIVITGLNNVLQRHIEQVGNIHGLAIPIRDFNKVWNIQFNNTVSVKNEIERNWHEAGTELITQAIMDVQGPRKKTQSDFYLNLKSGIITAKFVLNGSVVFKQVGSAFTASAMLKARNPVAVISNLIYTMAHHKEIAAEVDKYTAAAWIRRRGLSDAEMHTLMTQARKTPLSRFIDQKLGVINPAKWITAMDSAVALSLWKYTKEDVAERTGLTGEELLKVAARTYEDVIANTQSMSDSLHRPEIQKSGGIGSELLGTFKTDLYQTAGNILVALEKYRADPTKENKNVMLRTVYGAAISSLWSSVFVTALFAALRYKVNPYRDEEDNELTLESWLTRLAWGVGGDLASYIFPMGGGEIVDIFEAIFNGDLVDDAADSMVLSAISDYVAEISSIASKIVDGNSPKAQDYIDLGVKTLEFMGIPAYNAVRAFNAFKNHITDAMNGEFLSFEAGNDRTSKQKRNGLYNAMIEGDSDKIAKYESMFADDKAIASALKKALRENDPRIKEAAMAAVEGKISKRLSIEREIREEGNFEARIIRDAIDLEIKAIESSGN